MFRQLIILAVWFVGAVVWVLAPLSSDGEGALLEFSRGPRLSLGSVAAGRQVVKFDVTNVSGEIVRLDEVGGSCTCMDVVFEGSRLLPGESRECVVTIGVQPNVSQSTGVFFDVASPRVSRSAVLIVYRGVQRDELVVDASPVVRELSPNQRREVTLTCDWSSGRDLTDTDSVRWLLEEAAGATLRSVREEQRSARHIQSIAVLELDAADHDQVSAIVDVTAGLPPTARNRRRFTIPVAPSFRLLPDVVMLDHAEDLTSDTIGHVQVVLADGWKVDSVVPPDWMRADLDRDLLTLRVARPPAFVRGVASVVVTGSDAEGHSARRSIRCVVDIPQNP